MNTMVLKCAGFLFLFTRIWCEFYRIWCELRWNSRVQFEKHACALFHWKLAINCKVHHITLVPMFVGFGGNLNFLLCRQKLIQINPVMDHNGWERKGNIHVTVIIAGWPTSLFAPLSTVIMLATFSLAS